MPFAKAILSATTSIYPGVGTKAETGVRNGWYRALDLNLPPGWGQLARSGPEFPVPPRKFPDTPIKFPVPILREFVANLLI